MTEFCYFNQGNASFLSVPNVVFTGYLLVAVKRAGLVMMR